jgi:hypothetical protein
MQVSPYYVLPRRFSTGSPRSPGVIHGRGSVAASRGSWLTWERLDASRRPGVGNSELCMCHRYLRYLQNYACVTVISTVISRYLRYPPGGGPAESGADDDHVMGAGGGPRRHRLRSLAAAETPQAANKRRRAASVQLNVVRSCHSGNIGSAGTVSSTEEIHSAAMRVTDSVVAERGRRSPGRDAFPVVDSKIYLPFYRNTCYRVLVDRKSYAWTRGPVRRGWRHPGGPRAAGDGFKAPRRLILTASP